MEVIFAHGNEIGCLCYYFQKVSLMPFPFYIDKWISLSSLPHSVLCYDYIFLFMELMVIQNAS